MIKSLNSFVKNLRLEIFPISLILILAFSRLIPHPPNFTPIIATALMSGFLLKNKHLSLIVVLISMVISDLIIGFYSSYFFVYFSLILIILIFSKFIKKVNFKNLFVLSISSSLLFFVVTNFGVWMMGDLYDKNLNGLALCYILAIPYFTNTLLSTIFFSYSILCLKKLNYRKFNI
jgi:hypothetical protein